jgi:thymidylate synthase (FAD)
VKIIKPSVELLSYTPEPETLIERCGRIAYKSEDKIAPGTAQKFIQMIMKRGHESVLEHASATILFICDRGVTHEIVRHRLCSYTQESTRYCNYGSEKHGGGITVVKPPDLNPDQVSQWGQAVRQCEISYLKMLELSNAPQIARSVLPTCLKTEIAMTCNFREWRHFFKLRTAPTAHPQMQEVAKLALAEMKKIAPTVFGDFA